MARIRDSTATWRGSLGEAPSSRKPPILATAPGAHDADTRHACRRSYERGTALVLIFDGVPLPGHEGISTNHLQIEPIRICSPFGLLLERFYSFCPLFDVFPPSPWTYEPPSVPSLGLPTTISRSESEPINIDPSAAFLGENMRQREAQLWY